MTEDEARERDRTERLAQLGTLFAGFAHEVRNPLSTIGLNLQLVKEDFAEAESTRDRRTHKRLTVVQQEVKRLQEILEEFLGFVRAPTPKRRLVELNPLLRGLVDFTGPEAEGKGIGLRFYPGAEVGTVSVDPDLLKAAIVNQLRNAQEACSDGDEIMVSSKVRGDAVLIQVTDTGPGMPEDVRERAFTPYFSTKKSGTGLGLAMVRRTVEEHGGSLEMSSEPGRGTQFTIRLPLPEAAAAAGGEDGMA